MLWENKRWCVCVLITWVLAPLLSPELNMPMDDVVDFPLPGCDVGLGQLLAQTQVVFDGFGRRGSSHHGQVLLITLIGEVRRLLLDTLDPAETKRFLTRLVRVTNTDFQGEDTAPGHRPAVKSCSFYFSLT